MTQTGTGLSLNVGAEQLKTLREHHLGATLLKCYKDSPQHFLFNFFNKQPATPNLMFGIYYHTLILEPDAIRERFEIIDMNARPEPDKTMASNKNKAWLSELMLSNKQIVTIDDATRAREMRSVLLNNPTAHKFLTGGYSEKEFYLDDFNGCKTRAKPDKIKGAIMIDLKTAEDARPDVFALNAFKFGYHIQMAYYYDQIVACGIPLEAVVIIAQEKTPPYSVSIFQCTDQFLTVGQMEYTVLLEMHRLCLETGYFPGYEIFTDDENKIFDLSIPNYKIQEPKINYSLWTNK